MIRDHRKNIRTYATYPRFTSESGRWLYLEKNTQSREFPVESIFGFLFAALWALKQVGSTPPGFAFCNPMQSLGTELLKSKNILILAWKPHRSLKANMLRVVKSITIFISFLFSFLESQRWKSGNIYYEYLHTGNTYSNIWVRVVRRCVKSMGRLLSSDEKKIKTCQLWSKDQNGKQMDQNGELLEVTHGIHDAEIFQPMKHNFTTFQRWIYEYSSIYSNQLHCTYWAKGAPCYATKLLDQTHTSHWIIL